MAFEMVEVLMPDGSRHGPVGMDVVMQWVQQRRIPMNAVLVDQANHEQRSVESFPEMSQFRPSDDGISTLIPYKNVPALVGYYLGVFSLLACIPFIGIFVPIAAFILGIMGLRRAAANPEAKGRVHAWIGIICGAIFFIIGVLVNVGTIAAIIQNH